MADARASAAVAAPAIQPHGVLMVVSSPGLGVLAVSENLAALAGHDPEWALGRSLAEVVGDPALADALAGPDPEGENPHLASIPGPHGVREAEVVVSRVGAGLMLELVPVDVPTAPDVIAAVRRILVAMQEAPRTDALLDVAVAGFRRITGFDRAMVQRIDGDGARAVVAESLDGRLVPLLGMHFAPATLAAPQRAGYVRGRLRVVPDIDFTPVALVPPRGPDGAPLDISQAALRVPSAAHRRHLESVGARAALAASIVRDGRLWGLVVCHNAAPRQVDYAARAACELVAAGLAARIGELEAAEERERELPEREAFLGILVGVEGRGGISDALLQSPERLLAVVAADGACVAVDGRRELVGGTPPPDVVEGLLETLDGLSEPVVMTDRLAEFFPGSAHALPEAAGLLAVTLRPGDAGWVCWFREERMRVVEWAGTPSGRRRETVTGRARPWGPVEVDLAWQLRWSLAAAAVQRMQARTEGELRMRNAALAEVSAALSRSNADLEQFAAVASHDLRTPLRAITSFAKLLRRRLGDDLDETSSEYLGYVESSAARMLEMIRGLLDYARIERDGAGMTDVPLGDALADVLRDLAPDLSAVGGGVEGGDLPSVHADPAQLRQLLQNLLENAVRYRREGRPLRVRVVAGRAAPGWWRVSVADNGSGITPGTEDRIFEMFQRGGVEEDSGIGLGLAVCQRIVSRHGGRIWAEPGPAGGAIVSFTLPDARDPAYAGA